MGLGKVVKKVFKEIAPEIKADKENKIVEIKPKFFFYNITEAYYQLKGYKVRRVN